MTRGVLLVDDDAAVREALGQTLELNDFDAVTAGSFVEAKHLIDADFAGVIVSDIRMPGRDGFHLLGYAHQQDPDLPVILLTGEGDIPMAVRAMREGAFNFLEKPCAPRELVAVIERGLRARSLVLDNRRLRAEREAGDAVARMLFGKSDKAEALRSKARAAAGSGADVLITGPRGSGVSKVAEAIHLCSLRAKRPFEKRAAQMLGRDDLGPLMRHCAGGTLFLDRIDDMSMDGQLALFDLLEASHSDVCVIAGGSDDLVQRVQDGHLLAELYYRLSVMEVRIPALSERPADIPVLFRHYVELASEQAGLAAPEISSDVIAGLVAREWPGNARALMSTAMRFVLGLSEPEEDAAEPGLTERLAQVERSLLAEALRTSSGQASAAAKALKLPRKTFYDKLSKYGIRPEDFR
ncbi:MAG: sigma-54 dependent transcriptional regulator [Rhodobacteraceae bacterium]|nr:sigma-54 dependent transcriptional regulator [Paracoccaceae bacterium]